MFDLYEIGMGNFTEYNRQNNINHKTNIEQVLKFFKLNTFNNYI